MIYFPELRTRRLTIKLHEISILDGVTISAMPTGMEQAETTAFLRAALESVSDNSDPLEWTVEERTLAVCHYLASTSEDGPDFSVGDYHLMDYMDMEKQITSLDPVDIGEAAGDKWRLIPLTGRHAEAIERLEGEAKGKDGAPIPSVFHWYAGVLACQLLREGEEQPKEAGQAFDEWVLNRINTFLALPESDCTLILSLWAKGREQQAHLFHPAISPKGIVFNPKEGADSVIPPARFPAHACLSPLSQSMA